MSEPTPVKPCPWCGGNGIQGEFYIRCGKCGKDKSIERWQNAYCWKELDKQKAVIKDLLESAERLCMEVHEVEGKLRPSIKESRERLLIAIQKAQELGK